MTDLKPLSAEELAETRGLVWPRWEGIKYGWCNLCGFGWPCRCAALLATIEALQAEVTTLRTALETYVCLGHQGNPDNERCGQAWGYSDDSIINSLCERAREALHGRK